MNYLYKIWVILGLSVISFEVTAQCIDQQKFKIYNNQKMFFEKSGTGTMAIMPNVKSQSQAKSEYKFEAFKQDGTYKLEGDIGDIWFVINHRIVEESPPVSYIGVMVAKVLKTELASTLELYRNEAWFSLQDETELSYFRALFESAQNFTTIHKDSSISVESFNKQFKNWHALADLNPKLPSWELRREWGNYNLACLRQLSEDENLNASNIFVQARLLRFSPTTKSEPGNPVAWVVKLGNAKAVYIKIFSPISDFRGEYYIRLAHH